MNAVNVVIADDDPDMLALLGQRLRNAGYNVFPCENGNEAFDLVQKHRPVVLVADWEMPGLSGVDLCRKLRASTAADGVYIVLHTVHDSPEQVVAGFEAGADDYLVKTRTQTELLARVRAGTRLLKAHTTTGSTRTLSTKILTAVGLATLGICALAGWNLWSAQRATVRTLGESTRIHELHGKIVHLDEVLTMSARMAVVTGDPRWEDRYRGCEAELDQAIKETIELAQSSFESESAAQTDAANIKLVEMENRAFDLVRQGQHEAARDLLFSEEYKEEKRVYSTGMQAAHSNMDDRIDAQVTSGRIRLSLAGWMAVAALTFMTLAWVGILGVVGMHLRARTRAEGALQEAYGELETRVKERTAVLKHTNKQLSNEIAQRELTEKELAERADLAELDAEVGVALTRGDSLRAILQMCTAAVVQHLDAAFARVWTLNEKENMLELQASAGMYTHIDGPHGRVPVGAFKIGLIAEERRPHLTNDVRNDPRIGDPDWARREGMVSFAGHPLIVGNRLVGVMALFARKPLSEVALKALSSITDGIALGIQRQRAEEELRENNAMMIEALAREKQITIELGRAKIVAEEALTELEHSQSQLLQADKMASIGHLAAGVAHEINNPIGFITSNLNSLSRYVTEIKRVLVAHDELLCECRSGNGISTTKAEEVVLVRKEADIDYVMSDLVDLIAESTDGAKRVRQIVADLKDFSHVDSPDVADEDINQLIERTVNVASNELKYKTKVVREYGDIPVLPCYGGKLGQVFLNLLVNAAQAIKERGTITIRTGHEGDRIWIEIADTGRGIPPENVDHIFDPFFTTKEVGKGTGLGLHLALKIIHAHAGGITVQSRVGEGTTFRIELPATGPPAVKESERESVT